jgi:Uncharacterized protein family UPF0004
LLNDIDRENAEMKIYHRLKYFNFLKKKAKKMGTKEAGYPIIGVLGCMAERLKNKLLEVKSCTVMLCDVMSCYVMLCDVMLCDVMLCYVMLCYVM